MYFPQWCAEQVSSVSGNGVSECSKYLEISRVLYTNHTARVSGIYHGFLLRHFSVF
jgi:hypothetical protein